MPEENNIGLAELIEQVKRELLVPLSDSQTEIPLLSVDSVELELQVTVKKEGKGGLKIYVLELGGGASQDDVQKVKVKLSPLVDKQMLLKVYQKRFPEQWKEFLVTSSEAMMKGNQDELDEGVI